MLPLAEQEATTVSDVGVTLFEKRRRQQLATSQAKYCNCGDTAVNALETSHVPAKGDPAILCNLVVTRAGRARWLGNGDATRGGRPGDADGRGGAAGTA